MKNAYLCIPSNMGCSYKYAYDKKLNNILIVLNSSFKLRGFFLT